MKRWRTRTTETTPVAESGIASCGCHADRAHCHQTLVLHADGTAECEGYPACELDPAGHDLWMACADLDDCGCTGEDHEVVHDLPLAA